MKLIKNIQVYAPKDLGVKDVLISDYKIEKIDNHIDFPYSIETIDGIGCILTPGLIDRHVHHRWWGRSWFYFSCKTY